MTFEKFRKLNTTTSNTIPSCKQAKKTWWKTIKQWITMTILHVRNSGNCILLNILDVNRQKKKNENLVKNE